MTAGEALLQAAAALADAGIEAPAREARLLLAHARGLPPAAPPDPAVAVPDGFWPLLERRRAREPMALITGRQGFWTLDLEVSRDTLIPRADSEALIEAALAAFPDRGRVRRVLDLGTGTGALLLAALSEFSAAVGVGVDVSPAACVLARRNARAHGLVARAGMVAGHWAASLDARFDLVLANPPYVETAAIGGLMPEVAQYEPARALDGGADGLDAYRAIVPDLPRLLAPGGIALLEVGQGQAETVGAMTQAWELGPAWVHRDLGGVARVIAVCSAKKQVGIATARDYLPIARSG